MRSVEALTASSRDTFLWDEGLRGFGVKVTPAGNKTYLVQYRMAGRASKTQRISIGKHGTFTAAAARERAETLLRLAASGTDPREAVAVPIPAPANTLSDQASASFESYSEHFLAMYGRRTWRPRTYASAESNLRRWVRPVLGGRSMRSISRRELADVFDRLPMSSPALPRNLYALLRKLFAWAVERGDIDRSPFEQMRSPKAVDSRDRVLSDAELALIAIYAGELNAPFDAYVRLLIVTGQRRDEVSGMQWEELSQEASTWTIPGSRTKNGQTHLVPLGSIARIELNSLSAKGRWPSSGLVLTTTGITPISGYSKAKRQLDDSIARATRRRLAPWRFHDLRRTFATNMQRLGVRFEVTEALLNHVGGAKSGIAGVYQRHDWAAEKVDAIDRWEAHLRSIVESAGSTAAR